jgi:hypothetical protein
MTGQVFINPLSARCSCDARIVGCRWNGLLIPRSPLSQHPPILASQEHLALRGLSKTWPVIHYCYYFCNCLCWLFCCMSCITIEFSFCKKWNMACTTPLEGVGEHDNCKRTDIRVCKLERDAVHSAHHGGW